MVSNDKKENTVIDNKPLFIDRFVSKFFGKKFRVGDKVKFTYGMYYCDSYGSKPCGFRNKNMPVYITKVNKKGSHPYHISTGNELGKGDLGWLKAAQIVKVDEYER